MEETDRNYTLKDILDREKRYHDYGGDVIPKPKIVFYYETGMMDQISHMKYDEHLRKQKAINDKRAKEKPIKEI